MRGGDALLQRAHVGGKRRLITHRRRDTAEQRRHFGAGLGEAEDVVDEEQHVLALVAEVLGDGQAGQADAGAGARRLVHLAEHQRAFRFHARIGIVRIGVDLGFDELVIEVVAFAGTLADAGEHRVTAVRLGDVVDQFLDQHGLADAGAAEQADLAALGVGREQVDDLDAGDEDFSFGGLVGVGRRILVDGALAFELDGTCFVDRLADHVHDATQRAVANRNRDRLAGVGHFLAAHQTFGGVHRDRSHGGLTEMLGDFEHQTVAAVLGFQRIENGRQVALELHVDNGAHDLGDATALVSCCGHELLSFEILYLNDRRVPALDRLGAGDDLDQLLGDLGLTGSVVDLGLLADHFAGVAGGVIHRAHLRAVERGVVFQQRAEDLHREIARQQAGEDLVLFRLVFV